MSQTVPLTIPITAFGTVSCAGKTVVFAPNNSNNELSVDVVIGTQYTLSYTPYDATTQFSRFNPEEGQAGITMGTTTTNGNVSSVNFTVTALIVDPEGLTLWPFIVVYVKMPFYVQVYGDGQIDLSSNNLADTGTLLTVSGYMAIGSAFFEVDWALGAFQHSFTALYTPTTPGYSFGPWIETPGGDPTANPITFFATTNDAAQALGPLTNITLTVQQTAGGSIVSSPAGILTSNSNLTDTASFPYLSEVTLTATPAAGYNFQHWSGASIQTNNPVISLYMQALYTMNAIFDIPPPPETDIAQAIARDYVPSQGERADSQHICQCPCACTGCSPAFTSALNRTRQIRALISGSCCQYIPVGIVLTDGGVNYAVNDILQLVGGTPLEKPALFKVMAVSSGEITELKLIYGQPYRVRPGDDVLVPYRSGGSGGYFAVLWSSCLSPANLYRQ